MLDLLNVVENEKRKLDSFVVLELMKKITNTEPNMWGTAIIGFGSYQQVEEKETGFLLVFLRANKVSLCILCLALEIIKKI